MKPIPSMLPLRQPHDGRRKIVSFPQCSPRPCHGGMVVKLAPVTLPEPRRHTFAELAAGLPLEIRSQFLLAYRQGKTSRAARGFERNVSSACLRRIGWDWNDKLPVNRLPELVNTESNRRRCSRSMRASLPPNVLDSNSHSACEKFQLRAIKSERSSDQMITVGSRFKNLSEAPSRPPAILRYHSSRAGLNTRRGAFPTQ